MWTGIGAVGTAVFGMVFLQESTQALKLVSIALVVAGELLMDEGFAALSHRSVAQRADLPLSATTYYFASLDQLVHDAVRGLAAGWLVQADDVVGCPGPWRTRSRWPTRSCGSSRSDPRTDRRSSRPPC